MAKDKDYITLAKVSAKLLEYPEQRYQKMETSVKGGGYDILYCIASLARNLSEKTGTKSSDLLKTASDYAKHKEDEGAW